MIRTRGIQNVLCDTGVSNNCCATFIKALIVLISVFEGVINASLGLTQPKIPNPSPKLGLVHGYNCPTPLK